MKKADVVFINGEVITVDQHFSITEAVAILDHKIMAVGKNEEIKKYIGGETKIIDLEGKSLLPGFIDAHLHMAETGLTKLAFDVRAVESMEDMIALLKQQTKDIPKGQWIRGWGFNDNRIKEGRMPTRWELDEISTKHPIYIQRSCNHILSANSYALQLAEIHNQSEPLEDGEIEKENGIVNGVLKESARMKVLDLDQYSEREYLEAIQIASKEFIAAGITSVHDLGSKFPKHMIMMQKAMRDPDIKIRIYGTVVSFDNTTDAIGQTLEAGILSGAGNDRFRIGPSKLFLDGSLTGRTAAMKDGYIGDKNNKGIVYLSQEKLHSIMENPHLAGCQIAAHAIGDTAVEMMVDCIEHVTSLDNRKNHRHRIEHASVTSKELLKRIKDLEIVVIPNPAFLYPFGEEYVNNIGERAQSMFPIRSFLDYGIMVAAGSDSPVTEYNPIIGIYELVNRRTKNGLLIGPEERITIEEAIKIFTYNGAYASFEEQTKGSIEPGKLADLVVIDQSILRCPSEDILHVKVEMTVFNGEIVYVREPNSFVSTSMSENV
ncbi:amidohydrolase [Niallia nealsonii]|uniref:Amidohydrolase n=1 Tax=Niallia nealsonii TaxID=115979 RepID=A0A2N0Z6Z3_9BACI|nr:amidohydrolase [Niallia nealsonii]PKG25288.1 amidohydrolase [Niallia nealsonii]